MSESGELADQLAAVAATMQLVAKAMSDQAAAANVRQSRVVPTVPDSLFHFDGDSNKPRATEWLNVLHTTAIIQSWDDDVKVTMAQSHLRGPAETWFLNTFKTKTDWATFEEKFKKFFVLTLSKGEKWERMMKRVQGPNESTASYFLEKRRMCEEIDFNASETHREIIRGLRRPEVAAPLSLKDYTDLDDMWQDLSKLESVFGQSEAKTQRHSASGRREADAHAKNQSVKTERKDSGTAKREITCFNCGEVGHLAKSCERPRSNQRICFKCKQVGHLRKDCPEQAGTSSGGGGGVFLVTHQASKVAKAVDGVGNSLVRFLRVVKVGNTWLSAMIDTGSSVCTITESAVRKGAYIVDDTGLELYGFGTEKPAVRCEKVVHAKIRLEQVFAESIPLYVVPDHAQKVEVIVGRSFTELPQFSYSRIGDQFTIQWDNTFPFANSEIPTAVDQKTAIRIRESDVIPRQSVSLVEAEADEERFMVAMINESGDDVVLSEDMVVGRLDAVATEKIETTKKPISRDMLHVDESLGEEEIRQLVALCNDFRDCFALELRELGCTDLMEVTIEDVGTPVQRKPYRVSVRERETIKQIIREWRECGIVSDTTSPYATPVLLVGKKDGKQRLVGDYRFLNKQTIKKPFPIPTVDEQMECLSGAKIFAVLDLAHGFLQVPLSEESKGKTAFVTPDETGQFERMVFGLTNAPYEFSKLMNLVLGDLKNRVAMNYLDDILIPAVNFNDLLCRLHSVFLSLRNAKLTLKISKCYFGLKTVNYLGFCLSGEGISPGDEKLKSISGFRRPTSVIEVRRFLGLASYFRRFIEKFALRSRPLSDLTKKGEAFLWGDQQEASFRDLQMALCNAPVLQVYDPNAKFTEVHTDASSLGLAGALLQKGPDDQYHPVYYVSKKTTDVEARYHSSKLELMAVVWTVDRLRNFLIGLKFLVVTDCQALVYMNAHKTKDPQIARWCGLLQEFDFAIQYRPGSRMTHVDAMSRCPAEEASDTMENLYGKFDVLSLMSEEEHVLLIQRCDRELSAKIDILKLPEEDRSKDERNNVQGYSLDGGRLMKEVMVEGQKRRLYVIPKSVRKSILVRFHNMMGHFGVERTVARILQRYWFPRLRNYTKNHVRSCAECLISKIPSGKGQGLLHPLPLPDRPFERIHLDHLGPFLVTVSGNVYVLLIVDALTKFIRLYAVPNTSTELVIRRTKEYILDYGIPRRMVTDRGTCFTSDKFTKFCEEVGVGHTKVSSQRPQANGQAERVNRVLIATLMATAEEDEWDQHLKEVERNCNTAVNRTTGKTPFELLYGFSPRFYDGPLSRVTETNDPSWRPPAELRQEIRARVVDQQEESKNRYDKKRYLGVAYDVGDIVMVKRLKQATGESTKLQRKYKGPMVIIEVLPCDTYRIATLDDDVRYYTTTVHVSQLKLCTNPDEEEEEDSFEDDESTAGEPNSGETEQNEEQGATISDSAESESVVTGAGREMPKRLRKTPVRFNDYDLS